MLLIDSRNRPRRFFAQINERSITHRFISITGNSGNPSSFIESFFNDGTTLISTLIPFFRKSNTLRPMLLKITIIWMRKKRFVATEILEVKFRGIRKEITCRERTRFSKNNEITRSSTIDDRWSRRFYKDPPDCSWSLLHRWLGFVPRSGSPIKSQSTSILALCARSSNLSLLDRSPNDFQRLTSIRS